MIDLKATIDEMRQRGLDDSTIVDALACVREVAPVVVPARSAAAERQQRYRRNLDVGPEEWAKIRAEVFDRDGYLCVYCGADVSGSPQCDHVLPLQLGGSSAIDNLATSCKGCNSSKAGLLLADWEGRP